MRNSPSLSSLPLLLSLAGCAQSCNTEPVQTESKTAPRFTGYDLPCEFSIDMTAFTKDKNAEAMRLVNSIELCDQGIGTQSKVGLKSILEANCNPGDRKLYFATPTDLAKDPGFLTDLAAETKLDYILGHPERAYNWNAKLYDCQTMALSSDSSKTGQLCTAIFTEFSHAQVTRASFANLICTQDSNVAAQALAMGASTDLDLSKVRIGLEPNTLADLMLKEAQKEFDGQNDK